jgi:hypothetical protein
MADKKIVTIAFIEVMLGKLVVTFSTVKPNRYGQEHSQSVCGRQHHAGVLVQH